MNSSQTQRTALILGASSDIGLATAKAFLAAGWRVIGHYRTQRPELDSLVSAGLDPWQADFSTPDGIEAALDEAWPRIAQADCLINLAARLQPLAFETCRAQDILDTLTTNTLPGFLTMRRLGPEMARRGFGRIVHGSSVGVAYGGGSTSFCYSLSKHALEFVPNVARKWVSSGVLVNVVRIGVTQTRIHSHLPQKSMEDRVKLIPAGRMATPEEIAETFLWLGSERNGYITGQVITAAGGEG